LILSWLSDPIWVGGNRRQRGVRVPLSGPLHRCVHAGSWALRPAPNAAFWWLPKLASGRCCSRPLGRQLSKVLRSEKLLHQARSCRSTGVLGLCSLVAEVSRSRWVQRSHLGCGRGRGTEPSFLARSAGERRDGSTWGTHLGGAGNDLGKVACWRKASRAMEARDFHGSRAEVVLVWRFVRCSHWRLPDDRDVRASALSRRSR